MDKQLALDTKRSLLKSYTLSVIDNVRLMGTDKISAEQVADNLAEGRASIARYFAECLEEQE